MCRKGFPSNKSSSPETRNYSHLPFSVFALDFSYQKHDFFRVIIEWKNSFSSSISEKKKFKVKTKTPKNVPFWFLDLVKMNLSRRAVFQRSSHSKGTAKTINPLRNSCSRGANQLGTWCLALIFCCSRHKWHFDFEFSLQIYHRSFWTQCLKLTISKSV